MYSQFFGNYLLSKQAVTTEQLIRAIQEQHSNHLRLGTLAMHAGYMTASQVDQIIIRQTHEDRRFGELAIEEGYLTSEQVDGLLRSQTPEYLLIGQILVDDGAISNSELQELITGYQSENEMNHLEHTIEQQQNLNTLIRNLFLISVDEVPEYLIKYLHLLFNNLIRFVGEDFTPLNPMLVSEYKASHCCIQTISGDFPLSTYFDMTEDTAIIFASRYASESFVEYDEYVQASIEDFLNLHNGLFNVNISNEESIELQLNPPDSIENTLIGGLSETILLPVIYPFGTLNFLLRI